MLTKMKTKTQTQAKFRWDQDQGQYQDQDQDQDEREDWIRSSLRADELCFSPIHWKKVKNAKKNWNSQFKKYLFGDFLDAAVENMLQNRYPDFTK